MGTGGQAQGHALASGRNGALGGLHLDSGPAQPVRALAERRSESDVSAKRCGREQALKTPWKRPARKRGFILNQAVNLEKGVIFVAIPKNGTTSIRRQLKQPGARMIPQPHLSIVQVRDLMYAMVLRSSLGRNCSFPNPDVRTNAAIRAHSEAVFAALFKFGAVRNPWARAVSLWSRREGVLPRSGMSFEEFVELHVNASDTCRHPSLHRNQLDWLCDENGKVIMDYVYKLEELDDAVTEIEERTQGRLKLEPLRLRVNPDSAADRYREVYSDRARALVAKRFQRDIDYFGYRF